MSTSSQHQDNGAVDAKIPQSYAVVTGEPPWWINPFLYSVFFLLPFFLIAAYSAEPYMLKLGQRTNNLTDDNIMLGVFSIAMFVLGCLLFVPKGGPVKQSWALPEDSVNTALAAMGWTSLFCYLIYFSSLAMHPSLIVQFLSGDADAMYAVRDSIEQIPGVTSFMHADLPFFSLYSISTIGSSQIRLSKMNRRLFYALFFFILLRAIFGAERLALIEALVAYAVPQAAFGWRPGFLRSAFPYLGLVVIFAIFCFGEYFRSWQFYRFYYPSFWEFITVRFFGYFSTSINNGAGIVSIFPPLYVPAETVDGFYKLLRIFGAGENPGEPMMIQYLQTYATPEYNNQGGLYVPYMDYGIVGGAVCLLVMGCATGWLYRRFLAMSPFALLLYPSWFLALLDIVRVWIWGSSRFIPVIFISLLVSFLLRYRPTGRMRPAASP
jgi:oligosaccharide repeat unit polymerase